MSQGLLPVQEFKDKLRGFKAEVSAWTAAQTDAVDELALRHQSMLRDAAGSMGALKRELEDIRAAEARVQEQEVAQAAELVRLRAEYEAISAKRAAKPAELAAVRERIAALSNIHEQKGLELSDDRRLASKRLAALNASIEGYARALGLCVELHAGMLRFTFTEVHERAPAAALTFLLHVDDEGRYRVYECAPAGLAGLDAMVEELREDEDVAYFVQRMRRAFKQHLEMVHGE